MGFLRGRVPLTLIAQAKQRKVLKIMSEEKLISVVVPCYNVADYVEDCLKSILNQTYKNLEIIIINDASTDNTAEIVKKYVEKDDRITFIDAETNTGLSAVRNRGIQISHGDYLSFVDSDDILAHNFYEVLVNEMENDPEVDIAQCVLDEFHSVPSQSRPSIICGDFVATTEAGRVDLIRQDGVTFVMQSNKLFKREIFEHIRYPTGHVHEDLYVIYDEYQRAHKVAFTNKTSYYYRVKRSGSITGSLSEKRVYDCMYAYNHICNRAIDCGDMKFYHYARQKQLRDFIYMYTDCKENCTEELRYMKGIFKKNRTSFSKKEQVKFRIFFLVPELMGFFLKRKQKSKNR